ncbi:MAG: dephospho-CoA kinase [Prevotella sp.]|nr:dephospho-CoA kinase [Prevotella sp.]
MDQQLSITPAQYELINVLSCVDKEEDIAELKTLIVKFLNSRLQKEIDRLWDNGTLTEQKVAEWEKEHMRTPYKD